MFSLRDSISVDFSMKRFMDGKSSFEDLTAEFLTELDAAFNVDRSDFKVPNSSSRMTLSLVVMGNQLDILSGVSYLNNAL